MRKLLVGLILLTAPGCAIGTKAEKVNVSSHVDKYDGAININSSYISIGGDSNVINIRFTSREDCESFRHSINQSIDTIEKEFSTDSPKEK
jgi:hypothetical protein